MSRGCYEETGAVEFQLIQVRFEPKLRKKNVNYSRAAIDREGLNSYPCGRRVNADWVCLAPECTESTSQPTGSAVL